MQASRFERLLGEGLGVDVEAFWGAGLLRDRYDPGQPSWQWSALARPVLSRARSMLDMGTGDGSVLADLAPLPPHTVAYEEWLPTLPRATATLRPLGVHLVVALGADDNHAAVRTRPLLPFADASFDAVANRHEAFDAADVHRITSAAGRFLTQQVGSDEAATIRVLLGLRPAAPPWDLELACCQLRAAGWRVVDAGEERPITWFADVGALVAYIRTTPWEFSDALSVPDPWSYEGALVTGLRRVHEECARGRVEAAGHRFWVLAARC